jgi:hypothetical protein
MKSMQIFDNSIGLALAIVALASIVAVLMIDTRIVRAICQREGRPFPASLWFYDPYWIGRTCSWSWFGEARTAGYFAVRVILVGVVLCVWLLGLVALIAATR